MIRPVLFFILMAVAVYSGDSEYERYCKENPFDSECVSEALGGDDNIKKERAREIADDYWEYPPYYYEDTRETPSEDLDDPRESL